MLLSALRASSEIANPQPLYPNHYVDNLLAYDRNIMTPAPINATTPDTTTKDNREENDKTPTRASYEISSRAEFLCSFQETVSQVVKEGGIKQVKRRSREVCEESPISSTLLIIAIPEETTKEALIQMNLADTFEEEVQTTYLRNIQATIGQIESNRPSQDFIDTNITNDTSILERHKTKCRCLND